MSPLARKLLVKPRFRIGLLGAPAGYRARLEPLPEGAVVVDELEGALDLVQVFVKDSAQLDAIGPAAFASAKPDGILWVCYLKGGRKAGADLNRDSLHRRLGESGLVGVSLVAVDDSWSAMRFRRT
jgi:hypothetical protein